MLALDDADLSAIVYPPAPTPVTDPRKSGFDALAGYFISELTRTGAFVIVARVPARLSGRL